LVGFLLPAVKTVRLFLTELLNDHLDEWKKVIEFRHMKVLKSKNDMSNLDVAFIEGSIFVGQTGRRNEKD
jgi:coenzyme F420-reducing hydrogenase gamma subunit